MCGIFGYTFPRNTSVKATNRALLAANLATLNDKRGGHSWGMAGVRTQGKIHVRHGMGEFKEHAHVLLNYLTLFGHTRWATHGAKVLANAHPFVIGNVIGAHNGVLSNHEWLNKQHTRNFDVDSMHLFAHLNEGKDFSDIHGYGAIEWIDKRNPSFIYLCKLDGGSLAVAGIGAFGNSKGVVWSSDANHLSLSLDRAGIKDYFPYRVDEGQVYRVGNGEIVEWSKRLDLAPRPALVSCGAGTLTADEISEEIEDWDTLEEWWKTYRGNGYTDNEKAEILESLKEAKDYEEAYDNLYKFRQ